MFPLPLPPELEQLYDGTGRHLGGIYPPLMVGNALTNAYHEEAAKRPAYQMLSFDHEQLDLALVWMVPLGMTPSWPVPGSVLAAMVHAVDGRRAVIIHADSPATVRHIAVFVTAFSGGGHA